MKIVIVAILSTIISTSPVYAATPADEAVPPSITTPGNQPTQNQEEMRKALRSIFSELAKNKDLLHEMVKEILQEASGDKELLKDVIRGIAQHREKIKAAIKELIADKEIQKALREDMELVRDLLEELSKTEHPEKMKPGKNN